MLFRTRRAVRVVVSTTAILLKEIKQTQANNVADIPILIRLDYS